MSKGIDEPVDNGKSFTGTIKFINSMGGWGFITGIENIEGDCYFHNTEVLEGYESLDKEYKVSFKMFKGKRGLYATGVHRI